MYVCSFLFSSTGLTVFIVVYYAPFVYLFHVYFVYCYLVHLFVFQHELKGMLLLAELLSPLSLSLCLSLLCLVLYLSFVICVYIYIYIYILFIYIYIYTYRMFEPVYTISLSTLRVRLSFSGGCGVTLQGSWAP